MCSIVTMAWLVLNIPNPQWELGMRSVLRVLRLGLMLLTVVWQGMDARCSLLPRRVVIYGQCSEWLETWVESMFTVGIGGPSCVLRLARNTLLVFAPARLLCFEELPG